MDTSPSVGLMAAHRAMSRAEFFGRIGAIKVILDNGVDANQCRMVLENACMGIDACLPCKVRLTVQFQARNLSGLLKNY